MALTAIGGFTIGREAYASTPAMDVVTTTILTPTTGQVLTTTTFTVTWSYSSFYGVPQGWYRVIVRVAGTGRVITDSGFISGAAVSYMPPMVLVDGETYTVDVQTKNQLGVLSASATRPIFSVTLSDPAAYPDEPRVGSIYEIGINGVGYMLADDPSGQFKYARQLAPLEVQKMVSQSALFDERVDHYNFVTMFDWTGGAGQSQFNRQTSDPERFYDSDGVDCLTPYQLTLLHATALSMNPSYAGLRCVVASDALYALTAAATLSYQTTPGGSATTVALTGGQTVTDLTSDGIYWYAAHGGTAQGIARGTTSATLGWSAIVAEAVWYAGQRLCCAYKSGGSPTPNVFSTLTDAGAEEVASGRLILPSGWTVVKGSGGSGYVYFGAYAGDVGLIYKWQIGSANAPSVALELQKGQIPVEVYWYQGNVMVRTKTVTTAGGAMATIHRCVPDSSGNLTPFEVVTLGTPTTATDYSVGSFCGNQNRVFFSWPNVDGTNPGVGAIDLATGAYSKWLKYAAGPRDVPSLITWRGKVGFALVGTGVAYEQDTYVASGSLTTSVVDMNSALDKVIDTVGITTLPLATGESVGMDYSLDGGASFTAWPEATMASPGQIQNAPALNKKTRSVALRINLFGPGTTTPAVSLASIRLHALGLADRTLILPIQCDDHVAGLNSRDLPDNGPGAGAARMRTLESLIQTRVRLQDVDWSTTHTAEFYELTGVQSVPVLVYDRSVNRNVVSTVAVVTLRQLVR